MMQVFNITMPNGETLRFVSKGDLKKYIVEEYRSPVTFEQMDELWESRVPTDECKIILFQRPERVAA